MTALNRNVSQFNNEGIQCLQQCDLVTAKACFQRALHCMVDAGQASSTDAVSQLYTHESPATAHIDMEQPHAIYLCTQAFYLRTPAVSLHNSRTLDGEISAATLLYNLGLAYHILGLRGETYRCQHNLRKAWMFYGRAKALLEQSGIPVLIAINHDQVVLLSMAIRNNMGFLAYQVNDYETSALIYWHLTLFSSTVDDAPRGLLSYCKSQFLLNAAFLRPPHLAPAA